VAPGQELSFPDGTGCKAAPGIGCGPDFGCVRVVAEISRVCLEAGADPGRFRLLAATSNQLSRRSATLSDPRKKVFCSRPPGRKSVGSSSFRPIVAK